MCTQSWRVNYEGHIWEVLQLICYFSPILFHLYGDHVPGEFFFQALNGKLLKTKDKNTRREIRKELKSLSREELKRQQLAVTDVIKNANVVLTTLTGSVSRKLENISFDLVIIDEAAQALEIACWIALLKVMV